MVTFSKRITGSRVVDRWAHHGQPACRGCNTLERMRSLTAVAMLLVVGAGLTACTEEKPKKAETEPSSQPTPLSAFNPGSVTVARADFCGLVPPSAAEQALGGPVATTSDYVNGERSQVTDELDDVAHEFSCSWSGEDGATARAWVFAPVVTTEQARAMIRQLGRDKGCSTPDAESFGKPSVATVCTTSADDRQPRAAYHGLFVDAWVSCSVSGVADDEKALLDRAGEWCVQVATAVDTGLD